MHRDSRSRGRRLLFAAALAGGAIAGSATLAQVAINQIGSDGITIKGKVAELFGDKFILEDGSGRILIQTSPAGPRAIEVKAGETVSVIGIPRDRTFDARQILRENGEVVFAAPPLPPGMAPPPAAGLAPPPPGRGRPDDPRGYPVDRKAVDKVLQDINLTAMGEPVRHPKHVEIPARAADGKLVIVSLDRFGRLDEIEDADHDKERIPESRAIAPADVERIAREAGFTPSEPVERRKHHFEILVTNRTGETMELHVDLGGRIYKQVWVR
jgi:hypothetical protein